jgi:flagellar protein FliO/FliZ
MASTSSSSYGELLATSIVVLIVVCVVAYVVVRVARRFVAGQAASGGELLDVVARVPLEPRRSLYVVEVAGKTLLVGTSEMGLSVLSELDRERVIGTRARAAPVRPTFVDLVRDAIARRRKRDAPP